MWCRWDAECVDADLAALSRCGVEVLRVFPNWRDFQPAEQMYGGQGKPKELRLAGDLRPSNRYYLDETMLDRFGQFCALAQKHGLRLIVGLITGWMSGRLYTPLALQGKNLYSDPLALKLQQLFIRGFVERFRNRECICAWDLGNECNCMGDAASEEETYSWTACITNAIRACDPTRKILSGMHSLELEGIWNIQDQGELTDELCTHPYPYWVEHCQIDPLTASRTLLHATAQTQYYATVSGKPCLVEEIGGMGPMIADDAHTALFMRANLFSNWAHGASGLLWWCAFDQGQLSAPPYDWNMCERELGMMDLRRQPKPMLLEMKRFSELLKQLDIDLPHRKTDGVCILSQQQDHWGIAYTSYVLAKQAGLTLDFAWCEQDLPESDLYLLPSVTGLTMSKYAYDRLKQRIADGATLYISMDDGFLTEFAELTGLRIEASRRAESCGEAQLPDGTRIPFRKEHQLKIVPENAEVLAADTDGMPVVTRVSYGKGKVLFVNFPIEKLLIDRADFPSEPFHALYRCLFEEQLSRKTVVSGNPYIGVTEHGEGQERILVLVNYSDQAQSLLLNMKEGVSIKETLYGSADELPPCDAAILKVAVQQDYGMK